MPLFDYVCPQCGSVRKDVLVPRHDSIVLCDRTLSHGEMTRQPATAAFIVNGYAAKNLYSGGQTKEVKVKEKNMRVTVKS